MVGTNELMVGTNELMVCFRTTYKTRPSIRDSPLITTRSKAGTVGGEIHHAAGTAGKAYIKSETM